MRRSLYHLNTKRWSAWRLVTAGLTVLALVGSAFGPAVTPGQAAPLPALLTGRVVPPAGVSPADLHVTVTGLNHEASKAVALEPDGTFSFGGLPAGRMVVVVQENGAASMPGAAQVVDLKAGERSEIVLVPQNLAPRNVVPQNGAAPTFNFNLYKGEYWNNKPTEETADIVAVTAPNTTQNINLDLSSGGGTIAGRVVADGTGTPLSGLVVFAIGRNSSIISFDRTDANGDYKVTGIPADSFYVSVNAFLAFGESDYIGEYYNNATSLFGATPVGVVESQNVTGINFGLARGGTITGHVTAVTGGGNLANVVVTAVGVAPVVATKLAVTDASGHYTMSGLPAGSYKIDFVADGNYISEFYNNKPSVAQADPVAVTAAGTATVDASLASGGSITGTVVHSGTSQPLENLIVLAVDVIDPLSQFYEYTAEDGTYHMEGLPSGSYKVSVPEIDKWYNDKPDEASADPVVVVAGQTTQNINFSGAPFIGGCSAEPGTEISIGGVVMADAQPVADADVYLYLSLVGVNAGIPTRFLFATATTDETGHYIFDCLDEATYFVQAAPGFTDLIGLWYSNTDSANATSVHVSAGNSRSDINFALHHGGKISGRVTTGGSTGLAYVEVNAVNVATGQVYYSLSDQSGNYQIDNGPDGGLPSGSYKVWANDHTTAQIGLLPVTLARLEAVPMIGGIALEWSTSEETDHAGFNVYRGESAGDAGLRLTDRLITGGPDYRFEDTQAMAGTSYWYWLGAVDRQGHEERFGPVTATVGEPGVARLLGAFPNPLHAQSIIQFALPVAGKARVQVFDPSGRLVRTLANADYPAGRSSVRWDGRRDDGEVARAGVYFVQLDVKGVLSTAKLIVAR